MKQLAQGMVVFAVCVLGQTVHASQLVAVNIRGTDGTASLLNVGSPPSPIRIQNIRGLALTNPYPPGDNFIFGGGNAGPDLRVVDRYFQGDATAGPDLAGGTPPASKEASVILMEAQNAGTVGVEVINWQVTAYKSYDGTGTIVPDVSVVQQSEPEFAAGNIYVTVTGNVTPGDKVVVHNSGQTSWHLGGYADIDGDGIGSLLLNVEAEDFAAVFASDTNTSQDFNKATVTMLGWEIRDGEFAMGSFDVTFDMVTSAGSTWPGGDAFDVIPEPATLALLALGALSLPKRGGRRC